MPHSGHLVSEEGNSSRTRLLNRCFGVPELNSRDAMGCPGVLSRLDKRMRWVYYRCETQRGTRSAHYELIWEISDYVFFVFFLFFLEPVIKKIKK